MSPKKTLVLGTLLLLPVLAFLFLKMFGVNKFALPTYVPLAVDSTLVEGQWQYDTVYHQVPAFTFTSQNGQTFSSQDLQDKVVVAHFFYTACQSNCRQVSTQLVRVQDAFRLQPTVKLLSFSMQPHQDSAAVLKKYAASFRAKPDTWVFLTGPELQMQQFLQTVYPFSYTGSLSDSSALQMQQKLLLIDTQRHIRGVYDGTDAADIDRLITEINVLLSGDKSDHGK